MSSFYFGSLVQSKVLSLPSELSKCEPIFVKQMKGFEYIRGVILEPEPFDIEKGMITPTLKKRRAQLKKHYEVTGQLPFISTFSLSLSLSPR